MVSLNFNPNLGNQGTFCFPFQMHSTLVSLYYFNILFFFFKISIFFFLWFLYSFFFNGHIFQTDIVLNGYILYWSYSFNINRTIYSIIFIHLNPHFTFMYSLLSSLYGSYIYIYIFFNLMAFNKTCSVAFAMEEEQLDSERESRSYRGSVRRCMFIRHNSFQGHQSLFHDYFSELLVRILEEVLYVSGSFSLHSICSKSSWTILCPRKSCYLKDQAFFPIEDNRHN